jgi:murein L,D-transpeptidase YcbB/YkuD
MIRGTAFHAVGFGLLGFWLVVAPQPAAADPVVEAYPGGATTTYFGPSAKPATDAPAKVSTPPAEGAPATTAVTPAPSEAPAAAAAAPAPDAKASPPAAAAAAPPPPPPTDPVVDAVRSKLSDKAVVGKAIADDVAAAKSYYAARTEPLWIKDGVFTHKAKAIISELRKADDWGLESSDFVVPNLGSGENAEAQGAAEAQLTLAALKYARFARGGRLDPVSLSNILDMKPPVKDPKEVLRELASTTEPAAFLRGFNPKHTGFERLRQQLLKARGPSRDEDEAPDPALLVKLPNGKLLKPGVEDDQVALLRQRLKVAAETPADERLFDDRLADALRDFQKDKGLRPNGVLNNRTRAALNSEGAPKKADPKRNVDLLIANMERWRWLPVDLGQFYVMNNIPEFTSEIWKGSELKLKQKMIDGQPAWPTPVLAANMQYVIFQPDWGMPDGIKMKELLPRLRQASSSGFDFFDQLFGGGGANGGARVLEAYKLQASLNGRPVDADSVNWNAVDIRRYSFVQPPGPDNPLGQIKFRFPNRHDVYMHDTPERGLFAQSQRALSHGCMRVEEPRRTAEVILAEDKGWSSEKVGALFAGSNTVTLDKPVPVYLVYFTARVDDDGRLLTYADIYGNDNRVMSALRGRPVRYTAPEAIDPVEAADDQAATISDAGSDDLQNNPALSKKSKKNRQAATNVKRQSRSSGSIVTEALGGMFLN